MTTDITKIIKMQASELDFDACGFAKVEYLKEEEQYLQNWLDNNYAGNMSYMHNYKVKRCNPNLLLENAKSIIVVLMNYYPEEFQSNKMPQIASYAYGNDYHYIIKSRLNKIITTIESLDPNSQNMACCDTAPILERAWAVRAGLGWIGKSGMLINPEIGSFTFIGAIITSIDLEYAKPIEPKCGSCNACIDICPTKAIKQDKTLDARKCISYNTIENRDTIDSNLENIFQNKLYGCDECIKICPWNKKAKPHNIEELKPITYILNGDWDNFSRSIFKNSFTLSAMQRAGYKKLKNRLEYIKNHNGEI